MDNENTTEVEKNLGTDIVKNGTQDPSNQQPPIGDMAIQKMNINEDMSGSVESIIKNVVDKL